MPASAQLGPLITSTQAGVTQGDTQAAHAQLGTNEALTLIAYQKVPSGK